MKHPTIQNKFKLSLALLVSSALSTAQAAPISSIKIQGNKRVENETILSYLPLRVGDESDELTRNEALKTLYQTGLFSDIKMYQTNSVLVIDVTENSLINRIFFEGNNKLKDDKLKAELQLRPRQVLSRTKVQSAQQRILELYKQMGRFNAVVVPKIVRLAQDRVDLIFEINEGDVTHVRKINFIGNDYFHRAELSKVILTKPYQWYRFFASDDVFESQRFEADQQILRQFYLDNGFPDFRITSAIAELSVDKKDFFITITMDEGKRYTIGKVNIKSNVRHLKTDDMLKKIEIKPGDIFSSKAIQTASQVLNHALGEKGYAFANVIPDYTKNAQTQKVDLTFTLNETGKILIERIEIKGNDRTRDYVIRREIGLHEGDLFNSQSIQMAEQKLRETGYFKNVSFDIEPGSDENKAKIIFSVEEQSTGELSLAAGYSTFDKFLTKIGYTEHNFMGKGLSTHAEIDLSKPSQTYELGISNPKFMDHNLLLGGKVFHSHVRSIEGQESRYIKNKDDNKQNDVLTKGFRSKSTGFMGYIGYDLTKDLNQTFLYTFKLENVSNRDQLSDEAKSKIFKEYIDYMQNQSGRFVYSSLNHVLTFDRRDRRMYPTKGYILSMTNALTGLGGNVKYIRNTAKGSVYYTPFKNLTFNLKGSVGDVRGWGKGLRYSDLFTLGGEKFPGFDESGLGYREPSTNNSLRGRKYWTAKLQATFPIPGVPEEFSIKGGLFVMAGNLLDPTYKPKIEKNRSNVFVNFKNEEGPFPNKTRVSIGGQIDLKLPFAPLKLIYAKPIRKEKHDQEYRFLIAFITGADD